MCSCNFNKSRKRKKQIAVIIYIKSSPILNQLPPLKIIFHQFSNWALMKPKPLWVLSNWIKKKTIERLKKLLSPPHYYWYILPDKSFIICKVWLSYLTSINFLVILCLFTITHLLLCFFKYFSPNEFFSPFFFP